MSGTDRAAADQKRKQETIEEQFCDSVEPVVQSGGVTHKCLPHFPTPEGGAIHNGRHAFELCSAATVGACRP